MATKTTTITVPKEVSTALSLVIKNADDMVEASAMRESLKKRLKEITAKKDEVLKPLLEATKAERARWKPAEDKINEALDTLDTIMSKYQTEQRKLEQAKEEAIANRIGEGKGKLSAEKAVEKLGTMKRVDNKVASNAGATAFVTTPLCELENINLVPMEYHEVDMVKIRQLMKAGVKVAGIRYWSEERPRSSR